MTKKLQDVPIVGKTYHFFDDGKIKPSRHYMVKVVRVIPKNEAKNIDITIKGRAYDVTDTLFNIWTEQTSSMAWVYAKDTDYFVEGECRDYDEHNLWFVRTTNGGWFSMDIENWWQAGELDVDEHLYESIKDLFNDLKN